MLTTHLRRRSQFAQRGLSIIEFMVGVAVGLLVVGGATKLFVDYLGSNRRLLLETRVNQDLRAAADLIARDLRRGAYWRNATLGVSTDPATPSVPNPYRVVTYDVGTGLLSYTYDKDGTDGIVNSEDFGVKRDVVNGVGVVQLRTAGNWQTITDPGTMNIPAGAGGLSITETAPREVPLWDQCPCLLELTCFPADFAGPVPGPAGMYYVSNRPRVTIRQYRVSITGNVPNTQISRTITEMVRVRNDMLDGTCPNP